MQDQSCEITDDRLFLLHRGIVVILCSGSIKQFFDGALSRVEHWVELSFFVSLLVVLDDGWSFLLDIHAQQVFILNGVVMIFAVGQTLTEPLYN